MSYVKVADISVSSGVLEKQELLFVHIVKCEIEIDKCCECSETEKKLKSSLESKN